MVIGSRFIDKSKKTFKSTTARRIGIKIISLFMKIITAKKVYDVTSGFRAINKNIIEIFAEKYPVEYPEPVSEVTVLKNKYKIKEVSVEMFERQGGKSSIRFLKTADYMIKVCLAIIIDSTRKEKN